MRRRRPATILTVVMAWLLFASTALAITIDIDDENVYANGQAIIVTGNGSGGTIVTDSSGGTVDYNRLGSGSDPAGNTDVKNYNIYGGSRNGDVSSTDVTIKDGAIIEGNVYGGGLNGDVNGSTKVNIEGGTINGDVYGGGHDTENNIIIDRTANVTGSTNVNVSGGTVNGNVYGGGHAEGTLGGDIGDAAQANVLTGTKVEVSGGTVTGDVYGGGHADAGVGGIFYSGGDANATVSGGTEVTVSGGSVGGNVYGGGAAEAGVARRVFPDDGTSDATVNGGTIVTVDDDAVMGSVSTGGNDKGDLATAEVNGTKILRHSQKVTVTTNYSIEGVSLDPDVRSITVYSDGIAQTATAKSPSFEDDGDYDFVIRLDSESDQIVYGGDDVEFTVTGTLKTDTVTVTTYYNVEGQSLTPHVAEYKPKKGQAAQTATAQNPTFDGDGNYDFVSRLDSESDQIVYGGGNIVFTVTGTLKTDTVTVTTYYNVEGQSLTPHVEEYNPKIGQAAQTATAQSPTFDGDGNYNFAIRLDSESDQIVYGGGDVVFTVIGTLKSRGNSDSDTPRIPLGSGGPQAAIPLGIGVPSTGDGVSMNLLLIALGAAVVAFVAVRSKRYSVK